MALSCTKHNCQHACACACWKCVEIIVLIDGLLPSLLPGMDLINDPGYRMSSAVYMNGAQQLPVELSPGFGVATVEVFPTLKLVRWGLGVVMS